MHNHLLNNKEIKAYILLSSLVICGLAASLITAPKIISIGIQFPFSNLVFSILTYPIVDCICELWGKAAARQTVWIALASQVFIALIIQLSIIAPPAPTWFLQTPYTNVLSMGLHVVSASVSAFLVSQLLDIAVYHYLKERSQGKKLWLRMNLSMYAGQSIDSLLFINIVFYSSTQKMSLFMGSVLVKMLLSFLMTPIVYLIIYSINKSLDSKTLAFKSMACESS